ncbi:dihydroorotate dehydrogenase [Amycolatopsis jiangsuensis]|uniref:dihydrouracil dehydrogenase (NAD(+)) n=1 Tax=Amycolatopsis jiangsuensis TaxID=1181879 RepID=A0A840IPH5_9PSEU|nr:dihydroorotate dehydrogenase [Amycolatopsis jiangsuensis]MBB4683257.1 dihydroorotate dehydrogenase [Amycolatopsis jiangsuensis]
MDWTTGGLVTANPVWVGSSELTMTPGGLRACVDAGAGAVVAKSVNESAAARRQLDIADYAFVSPDREVRQPGVAHREDGLLNRSGLAQVALDEWLGILAEAVSHGAGRGCPVLGSITLGDPPAAARIGRAMAKVVPGVELNIGAPHGREATAVRQLTEVDAVAEAVRAVRATVDVPLFVKLPGQASDVVALARAARSAGADGIGLVGRYPGFLPDLDGGAVLGSWGAWGSPACLPMSLYWVSKTRLALGPDVPLVGTNGARTTADVLRFLASGAGAVEIVTALWTDGPPVLAELAEGVQSFLEARDLTPAAFVGSALEGARDYADVAPVRPPAWLRYAGPSGR